jgi:hypothetical protein
MYVDAGLLQVTATSCHNAMPDQGGTRELPMLLLLLLQVASEER